MNLYKDHDLLATTMRECISRGETVFQIHRLAATEQDHVAQLLRFFNPPKGATVLDLGCGIGAVAEMMYELRKDLRFILLNNSQLQLDLADDRFRKECRSFDDLAGIKVDAVMMQYALGHAEDLYKVIREIAGVLPAGGVFMLYDVVGNSPELREALNYNAWERNQVIAEATKVALNIDVEMSPENVWVEHFYNKMPKNVFEVVFTGTHPWLARFVKQ